MHIFRFEACKRQLNTVSRAFAAEECRVHRWQYYYVHASASILRESEVFPIECTRRQECVLVGNMLYLCGAFSDHAILVPFLMSFNTHM